MKTFGLFSLCGHRREVHIRARKHRRNLPPPSSGQKRHSKDERSKFLRTLIRTFNHMIQLAEWHRATERSWVRFPAEANDRSHLQTLKSVSQVHPFLLQQIPNIQYEYLILDIYPQYGPLQLKFGCHIPPRKTLTKINKNIINQNTCIYGHLLRTYTTRFGPIGHHQICINIYRYTMSEPLFL
jgi:hypothetical protein